MIKDSDVEDILKTWVISCQELLVEVTKILRTCKDASEVRLTKELYEEFNKAIELNKLLTNIVRS